MIIITKHGLVVVTRASFANDRDFYRAILRLKQTR